MDIAVYKQDYIVVMITRSTSLLILCIIFILWFTEPSEIFNEWLRRSSDKHELYKVLAVRRWSQVFTFTALKLVARAPG